MRKPLQSIAILLAAAAIGAVGYWIGQHGLSGLLPAPKPHAKPALAKPALIFAIPLLLALPWLAIAWHEFGHALGGWLSGFRLVLFAAGPLRLHREGARLRPSFNRTLSLWGGVAASIPPPGLPPETLRRRMLAVVAGGPLLSLLGGLVLLLPNGGFPAILFGAISLTLAAVTLIPYASGGFVTDGGRILQLLGGGDACHRWIAGSQLTAWSLTTRPRDWPAGLVHAHSDNAPPSFDGILAMWMRHAWHLDRGELPEAAAWLEQSLRHQDQLPSAVRPLIHLSAADYHARRTRNAAQAQAHWEQAKGASMLPSHAIALTEAAVRAANGCHAAALEALTRAQPGIATLHGSMRELAEETAAAIAAECRR